MTVRDQLPIHLSTTMQMLMTHYVSHGNDKDLLFVITPAIQTRSQSRWEPHLILEELLEHQCLHNQGHLPQPSMEAKL